jgi:hypothetical protein
VPIKRIKSTWHRPTPDVGDKSLQDIAGAIAFIAWRIALESAKDLHRERFNYESDPQRAAVIAEFLAFLVQVADRLIYDMLDDADRAVVINALGQRLAEHVQDNLADLFGPGDYRTPFIETLNERLQDYAEFSFADDQPDYRFMRYFGDRILKILGEDQTNRWVIDQIMDKSGPEAVNHMVRSVRNLFD